MSHGPYDIAAGPRWPDTVHEILAGDHVTMLAYVTPAKGVVLTPVTNFGPHNRLDGIARVNSSVGAWKKLDRIRRNPQVALAFHAREHATHDRSEYVLVQGRASLSEPIADYPGQHENWGRFERWDELGGLWKRWLRVYALRVEIRIAVERVVVWPDLGCAGAAAVHGSALPSEHPPAQRPPGRGTGPRLRQARAARRAARLPHRLLGWVGSDGFPVVAPVEIDGSDDRGILLRAPGGIVPQGGRRAGLTAHWFAHGAVGQNQRVHTGWLETGTELVYAPHTAANYRFPASERLFHLVAGGGTRRRLRRARRLQQE